VKLLYNNVLHREGEQSSIDSWTNGMKSGMSRSDVVLGFSESQGHISNTSSGVLQGLWVSDGIAAQAARLYDTVLDRLPDAAGLSGWTGALKSRASMKSVADGFTGYAEFQQKYGSLDDSGFVRQLYRNVLDREGEQSGVDAWTGGLKGGMSRSDVVVGFSASQEHINKMAPYIDSIWYV
jgi:hypothetical protein